MSTWDLQNCQDQKERFRRRRYPHNPYLSPANKVPLAGLSSDNVAICDDMSPEDNQRMVDDANRIIAVLFQKHTSADVNEDPYPDDYSRREALERITDGGHVDDNLFGKPKRLKRNINSEDSMFEEYHRLKAERKCQKTLEKVKDRVENFSSRNPDSPTIVVCDPMVAIGNLTHYTKYKFEIRACFDPIGDEYLCSDPISYIEQTMPHPDADIMTKDDVKLGEFTQKDGQPLRNITIRRPKLINGQILFYLFRYRAAGIDEWQPEKCIPDDPTKETIEYSISVYERAYDGQIAVETLYTVLNDDDKYSDVFRFKGRDNADVPTEMAVAIGVSGILLLISFCLLTWYAFVLRRKRNLIAKDGMATPDWISMNPDYPLMKPADIPSELECNRDDIEVLQEIGRGSFGVVYRGIMRLADSGKRCQVAVKSLRCDANMRQRNNFLHEALILAKLDCHHIVKLRGVVSRTQPIYVVMELMEFGDLRSFLANHRPDSSHRTNTGSNSNSNMSDGKVAIPTGTLGVSDFTQMAGEVADGLAYLAARKIIHRDLAARNCLVARDRTVKLGDFGLSRDVYDEQTYTIVGRALLPIRWMAPESLRDGVFNTYSDVWSYGLFFCLFLSFFLSSLLNLCLLNLKVYYFGKS